MIDLTLFGRIDPELCRERRLYIPFGGEVAFSVDDESRIIEMAWEDRTPFEAIEHQFGLNEAEVIKLMRYRLKPGSFRLWRKRVSGRVTKHTKLRSLAVSRGYCPTQYKQR